MSNSTKYTVATVNGEIATRSSKASAIKLADENRGPVAVTVTTGAGNVVHTVDPVGTRAKPFTRTETPTFEAPELKGFVAAYTRARIQTVVYRAVDRSGYLVLHVPTETRLEAANTTEAREHTNALAAAHKEAKAKLEAEQKAEKAAAKEAKRLAKEEAAAAAAAAEEAVEVPADEPTPVDA